jgi:hypothetical protein
VAGAEGSIDDAESISRAAAFFEDCDGDDPDGEPQTLLKL